METFNRTYSELHNEVGELVGITSSDGWWIPINPENSDYQAYLRWLENPDTTYDAQQAMHDAYLATE